METLTARSPDGRVWEVGATRERPSFWEQRHEPGFWAYVVFTAIFIAIVIVVAFYSTFFAILAAILLGIWLIERISNLLDQMDADGRPSPDLHDGHALHDPRMVKPAARWAVSRCIGKPEAKRRCKRRVGRF